MPSQRVCGAEMQTRHRLSNGPPRARGKELVCESGGFGRRVVVGRFLRGRGFEYSATQGLASVAGDIEVSRKCAKRFANQGGTADIFRRAGKFAARVLSGNGGGEV